MLDFCTKKRDNFSVEDLRGYRAYDFNADRLHGLFCRASSEGGNVVELWATIHGELVIVRRPLPETSQSSLKPESRSLLDRLQAKLKL